MVISTDGSCLRGRPWIGEAVLVAPWATGFTAGWPRAPFCADLDSTRVVTQPAQAAMPAYRDNGGVEGGGGVVDGCMLAPV